MLRQLKGIRDCIVLALDHAGTPALAAYVRVVEGLALTADEVLAFGAQSLAAYMVPSAVTFMDEFPLTGARGFGFGARMHARRTRTIH